MGEEKDLDVLVKEILEVLPESVREEIKEYVENRDTEALMDYLIRKFNLPRDTVESLVSSLENEIRKDKKKVHKYIRMIKESR